MKYNTQESEALERGRIDCQDCTHCCEYSGGIVLSHEVTGLAAHLKLDEKAFKEKYLEPHTQFGTSHFRFKSQKSKERPYGPCIFLEKNGCKIHAAKPQHCRVGTCEPSKSEDNMLWFQLKNFLRPNDEVSMREYVQHLRSGGKTLPGAYLHELVPDKEKLKEMMNNKGKQE